MKFLAKNNNSKVIDEVVLTAEKYTGVESNAARPISSSANVNLVRAVMNNADSKMKALTAEIMVCEREIQRLKLELQATEALKITAEPFLKEMELLAKNTI